MRYEEFATTTKSPLTERPSFADTIKTKAKALGSRIGNAALASAGGNRAKGRLGTRIIADRMLKGWLRYQGATGVDASPDNIYKFLSQYIGHRLDDATLRAIAGVSNQAPTAEPDQSPEPHNDPRQTAMNFDAPAPQQQAAQSQPQPAQQQPVQPTTPAQAPAPASGSTAPTNGEPQGITPQQFQAAMKLAGGNPNAITPAIIDQVVRSSQPVAPKPPVATPPPQTTPRTAPQAPPQPVTQPARPPRPASAQGPAMQPARARSAQSPAQPKTPGSQMLSNLSSMVRDDHLDPKQTMGMISRGLQKTKPGSPERAQMINLLKALRKHKDFADKVPQINQLGLPESRLNENADLSRSELDAIFIKAARAMIMSGSVRMDGPSDDQSNDSPQQQQQSQRSTDADLDAIKKHPITPEKFSLAYRHLYGKTTLDRQQERPIRVALQHLERISNNGNDPVMLKQLLDVLRKDQIRVTDQLRDILLRAAAKK